MKNLTTTSLAIILLALVGCHNSKMTTQFHNSSITVHDLLLAQQIDTVVVRLPKDLKEDEIVMIELYGESGVISSHSLGNQFEAGKLLKLFIHKNEKYKVSYVTEGKFGYIRDIDFGEATLEMMSPGVYSIYEPLVIFVTDDPIIHGNSWRPHGDNIAIRVTIEE